MVNQHKLKLGAKPETKTKIVKGNVVSKIKYILPTNRQYEYSVWLNGKVNTDPNFRNYYLPLAQEQLNSTRNINAFLDFLQQQNSPRYLTGIIKAYIKEMMKQNKTNDDIFDILLV